MPGEEMSNRNSKNSDDSMLHSTEFQLHKSQLTIFQEILDQVIDYTEHRLKKYANSVKDHQQRAALLELVERYKKGMVAIAWKKGRPVWLSVTKDS